MALRNVLVLRKPPLRDAARGGSSGKGGCLEGRTALLQPTSKFFTPSENEKEPFDAAGHLDCRDHHWRRLRFGRGNGQALGRAWGQGRAVRSEHRTGRAGGQRNRRLVLPG